MHAGKALWLLLAVLLSWSFMPGSISAQQAFGEQERFARAREIDATKEQIRRLFAEGRFQDVLKASDHLLTLDPDNSQAVFWKDLAERKILTADDPPSIFGAGSTGNVPDATPIPMKSARDLIESARQSGAGATDQPLAPPASTRPRSSYRSQNQLPMGIIIGLVVGVIVLLAVAIIAWIMFRSSRKRLQSALDQVRMSRNLDRDATVHEGKGMADQPTQVTPGAGDEDTSITQHGFTLGQADEPTVSEPGDIMSSLSVGPDEESRFEVGGGVGFPDVPTLHEDAEVDALAFQPPPEEEEELPNLASGESQIGDVEEVHGDTFAAVGENDDSISIAGSLGAEPAEEEEDKSAQSYNSLMFAEDETRMPGPEEKSEEPEDPNAMSYNSLMFAEDETRMPSSAPPEESGPSDDANALSYNSLMFPGEETRVSGQDSQAAPSPSEEDLSKSSFNKEYQNMMFGEGSEETKNLEPVDDALFDTIKIEGDIALGDVSLEETMGPSDAGISGEEVTMQLPGTGGGTDPAAMFASQKNAGRQALEKGNFSRAVECLSVAASLRPDDQEVSKLLDEAKRKRNG